MTLGWDRGYYKYFEIEENIDVNIQSAFEALYKLFNENADSAKESISKVYELLDARCNIEGRFLSKVLAWLHKKIGDDEIFFSLLSNEIQEAIYPRTLTYRILDGKERIGANCIEIAYHDIVFIVDCGDELEATEQGALVRSRVRCSQYDAAFITHYHFDHSTYMPVDPDMPVYIGGTAKKVLKFMGFASDSFIEFNGEIKIGEITVTPFLCDHSAIDSYMLLFEADGKKILYTGDFRSHGRKSFPALLNRLPKVDTLICESTTMGKKHHKSEYELENELKEIMKRGGDVYVIAAASNIDRIVSIYKAGCGRDMLVDISQARLLDSIGGSIPHPRSFKNVKKFSRMKWSLYEDDDEEEDNKYESVNQAIERLTHRPTAKDLLMQEKADALSIKQIIEYQSDYTMLIRSGMEGFLSKIINYRPDCTVVYSMWQGYREQENMDNLISMFNSAGIEVITLHTSGHADKDAVDRLIAVTEPQKVEYVHGISPKEVNI